MGSYGAVISEVESILSDPSSNLLHVADIIDKDPDLTARLLRLGNSSFYGFTTRLETVSEAIGLIGVQQVIDILNTSNVIEIFDGVSPEAVSMESFWKHSLACGTAARIIAISRRIPKSDKFFVAGLLHDIGRLVLFSRAPQKMHEVFQYYRSRLCLLRDAETHILGYDHSQVGEALLKSWNYPPNLVQAVACHNHPMSAGAFQIEASVVHVANYLISVMELGCSGEHYVEPLQTKAWERLGLSTDLLQSFMDAIDEQFAAVEQTFLTGS